jgi:uncharacterized protein involved in cysteine biosynthesis
MNFFLKFRQILSLKVPDWLGLLCYTLLALLILVLVLVLIFPGQVGNFIIEHDIRFLQ